MNLNGTSWVLDAFRTFFGSIDKIIYTAISYMFQAILQFGLTTGDILKGPVFEKIASRLYVFLSIFMVFKLTLNLLNAMLNPDLLTDKTKGIGKLVTRLFGSIVMLMMVGYVFDGAMVFQNKVIPVIPQVILGKEQNVTVEEYKMVGEEMSFNVFSAFFFDNEDCKNENGYDNGSTTPPEKGDIRHINTYRDPNIKDMDDLFNNINTACTHKVTNEKIYKYKYWFIISTITGGFMIFVLIGYTIDIVIRIFKLMFLRIIAPVPILSFVDPKSASDGMFGNWSKTVISTYLDIFLRLGILYFVVLLIKLTLTGKLINFSAIGGGDWFMTSYMFIFMVIGLFMFMKFAPTFMKTSLGIKRGAGTALGTNWAMGAVGGMVSNPKHGISGALAGGKLAVTNEAASYNSGKTPDLPAFTVGRGADPMNSKSPALARGMAGVANRTYASLAGYSGYAVKDLKDDYNKKSTALATAVANEQSAKSNLSTAQSNFDRASSDLSHANEELANARAFKGAGSATRLATAIGNVRSAQTAYTDAGSDLSAAQSAYATAQSTRATAKKDADTAESAYKEAAKNRNKYVPSKKDEEKGSVNK